MSPRLVVRALAALVMACGLVPVLSGTSWACTCVAADVKQHAIEATEVYEGTITEITPLTPTDKVGSLEYSYTVDVGKVLKGHPEDPSRIASPAGAAQCGIVLEEGPVIVFDRRNDGQVGLCDGTTQDRVAELTLMAADALKAPETEAPHEDTDKKKESESWPIAAGAATVVAAIAALVASRGESETH